MFCAVVTMPCRPDEHSRFTDIATESIGRPAWIDATAPLGEAAIGGNGVADRHVVDRLRVDARASTASFITVPASSAGSMSASDPPKVPIADRAAPKNHHITLAHALSLRLRPQNQSPRSALRAG